MDQLLIPSLAPSKGLEAAPIARINGSVGVVMGDYVDQHIDIAVLGIQPIVVRRSYATIDSPVYQELGGWRINTQCKMRVWFTHSKKWTDVRVVVGDHSGG